MRQILSSKTRRQLELVELLFDNEWITFVKASEQLKVPTKTLKTDINELDMLFNKIRIKISKNMV
ncbi:helix-turn-helix domain-containing protein [Enterococcus rivorum]|nr:helix-turn-helix domain-containing protein [Enterococcus rivorum]MBP2098962.1 putative DNA-binding transcriptional regulator YafY [Enterococcus rivorum]